MATDPRTLAMRLSLAVSVLMLVGKLGAYLLTGSAAILSDAAESVIHGVATGGAALSLHYARKPPDQQHPYGHGKIAFFSAGFEGALIFIAALYIVYAAVRALIVGPELTHLDWGLLITGALAAVNAVLGLHLIRVGRAHNSIVLVANGRHVLTDMWTSVGVVIGVAIVWLTDIQWIDPVVALAVGANILWSGGGLVWRAVHGLLDEAAGEDTQAILEELDQAKRDGLIADHHQMRHRRSDNALWIEVHALLPGELPLAEAHERVTRVEDAVRARFPKFVVHVTTHLEPHRAHADHHPEGHPELHDPYEPREH